MATQDQPIRLCMGCGERELQTALLRVSTDAGGKLRLTPPGGHHGRSGYLHRNPQCWQRFAARKGVLRSLGKSFDRDLRRNFIGQLGLDAEPAGSMI